MARMLRSAALLLVPALIVLASCSLADGHCIAMSDCDDTATCVEGRCEPNSPDPTLLSATDDASALTEASITSVIDSSVDGRVTVDASQTADASDASGDALTDATAD